MVGLLDMSPWPLQNRPDYSNSLPPQGPLLGLLHALPALAPKVSQGSPRPFAPGEMVRNPGGSWSSEVSITVPHPTQKGKWTNIPSVWMVDGIPHVLSQEQAIRAAMQSGLNWPAYDSSQVADKAAGAREDKWQTEKNPEKVPPLWVK